MENPRRLAFLLLISFCLFQSQLSISARAADGGAQGPLLKLSDQWSRPDPQTTAAGVKFQKSPLTPANAAQQDSEKVGRPFPTARSDDARRLESPRHSDLIEVPVNCPVGFYIQRQSVKPVLAGDVYHFSCQVKTEEIKGGAGAYMVLTACDPDHPGQHSANAESTRLTGDQDWTEVDCVLMVPDGAKALELSELVNGTGRAYFANQKLELVSKNVPLGHQTIEVKITRKVLRDDFLGFGFEDDPFFFTSYNYRNGVTDEDAVLRERRIHELKPALVRVFIFWDAFNPGHNLRNITWRTEDMDSLYRTLDVYQKMKVPVNLTGAFWGWENENFPYIAKNVDRGAEVYVQVLKHLVKEKGYSCIKYVTIGNEPDLFWEDWDATFATFIKTCHLVHQGLLREGLPITLVGCDTALNYNWFANTVQQADDCFGSYSVHKYLNVTQYPLLGYHLEKTRRLVAENVPPKSAAAGKPLFLWEYGYQDDHPSATVNDEMKNFRYGLLSAFTCISLMNHGFSGGSVWCLHAMFYVHQIADKMEYGLWEYKEKDWQLRPVYYAYGLFTKFFEAGMKPLEVLQQPSSNQFHSAALTDAQGNLVIYLLNMSNQRMKVHLTHLPRRPYQLYAYAEGRLPGAKDQNYEKIESLNTGKKWDSTDGFISVESQSLIMLK